MATRHMARLLRAASPLLRCRCALSSSTTVRCSTDMATAVDESKTFSDDGGSELEQYDTSSQPFSKEILDVLRAPLNDNDVEIKPDGLLYLPEIKYRRVLLEAFGAGGWVLVPKSPVRQVVIEDFTRLVTREYAMYCHGHFISLAMGEHVYYCATNIQYGKACESAKSNALMRCCKDLGIASELWDPQYISKWRRLYAADVWCVHQKTKDRKKLWRRKTGFEPFAYPWKELP